MFFSTFVYLLLSKNTKTHINVDIVYRFSARNRACKEKINGTQTRSPKASIKPNPSQMISGVERIEPWQEKYKISYVILKYNCFLSEGGGRVHTLSFLCRLHIFTNDIYKFYVKKIKVERITL